MIGSKGSKIQEILADVERVLAEGEPVKFFNEEQKHYATVGFRDYANYSLTGELEDFNGYIVKFYLPDGYSRAEFGKHQFDDVVLSIYTALENSYEDQNLRLIEMVKRDGEQEVLKLTYDDNSIVDIAEVLKITFDHNLQLWIFDYEDGKLRVEDEKHLAVQILNEFHNTSSLEH